MYTTIIINNIAAIRYINKYTEKFPLALTWLNKTIHENLDENSIII